MHKESNPMGNRDVTKTSKYKSNEDKIKWLSNIDSSAAA